MLRLVLPLSVLLPLALLSAPATEVERVTQAIETQGGSAALYNRRGEANFRAGSIDSSIADFDRAIRLEPRLAPTTGNAASRSTTPDASRMATSSSSCTKP
ncbi:MAG: hypothetical protein R2724_17215 [Bryobacterales bacterium]